MAKALLLILRPIHRTLSLKLQSLVLDGIDAFKQVPALDYTNIERQSQ